jgi:hypothetical protein
MRAILTDASTGINQSCAYTYTFYTAMGQSDTDIAFRHRRGRRCSTASTQNNNKNEPRNVTVFRISLQKPAIFPF